MTRSNGHRARPWLWLPFLPLLLSAAPRSYLAHDEGYYALQARWIQDSGQWLAPLWWDQPLFDRTIGVQWLIAGSQQLLGPSSWAAHLPSLLAAAIALWLTAQLARQLLAPGQGWLSAALLALTPLFLNYAHLASQDMPLLALELVGVLALLKAEPDRHWRLSLAAGIWLGPAFLVKGFMAALPAAALLPLLLLKRRHLLRSPSFWGGLALGWLPAALWLALSLQRYGAPVVGGLLDKLLYLSESDVYSAGPLYYLLNIPANCAPWSLLALVGLIWGLKRWRGLEALVLLVYPLALLLLLSCFRTKTPYYGLQLTPFLAIWAADGLNLIWQTRAFRWLVCGLGAAGVAAGVALFTGIAATPLSPLVLGLAAFSLGLSWLLLPWQRQRPQALTCLLLGPWLALVLMVQAGLFTDRSPQLRQALEQPALQEALRKGPVAVISGGSLSGEAHAQLILLALAAPELGPKLDSAEALQPGQTAWIETSQLQDPANQGLRSLASGDDLAPWTLVRKPAAP